MISDIKNHPSGAGGNPIDRQLKIIKGILFGIGLACGVLIGWHIGFNGLNLSDPWPPAMAAGIASLYVVAMIAGSVALSRVMDEVEKQRSYKAGALAGAIYVIVYPVWFLLWKGGFMIEPIHWLLFILFWVSLASGTIYYRFR